MSRRQTLVLLASLYLAQGLPYGFFTQALPVLMREQGASLKSIAATSLLFLPWALKFLWAPFVDRYGTRRQWLLPLQWGSCAGAGLLAFTDLGPVMTPVFAALLLFNLAAAAQDVVTDGLAVRVLADGDRGFANSIQVGAYRIGMILGGGALLWVFAQSGWQTMFIGMALMLALLSIPALFMREPPPLPVPHSPQPLRQLFAGWTRRLAQPGVPLFIGLICFYKFGDTMAASLVGPFMKDLGWATENIALLKGTLGSCVSLVGAAIGGYLALQLGRRLTLLHCGLLQSLSLLPYALAAAGYNTDAMVWLACIAEHLFGSMATVALFTLMMDASDPEHASTDYSLYACAIVTAQGLAMFSGAAVADAFGYAAVFGLAVGVSAAGCLALVTAVDRQRAPPRLQRLWRSTAAPLTA